MITLRKLEGLPERTRGRKLLTLLAEDHQGDYGRGLIWMTRTLLGETDLSSVPMDLTPRAKTLLRNRLAQHLGIEAADWDLQAPPDRVGPVLRFPCSVWLDDLRSPFNVGSILRTAEAYGFESVWHSPQTPGIDHPRTRRSAMGSEDHVAVRALSLDELREQWGNRPAFALELGGTPVESFRFPKEGLVLVGGEELGLSSEARAWAQASYGCVTLPLYGRKASLNVGVAFGVLAAFWVRALSPGARTEG